MTREVIAFPRRDRVVLALLLSEDVGPGGLGRLTVVAEDGARFALPADQVIGRFAGLVDARAAEKPAAALAALRRAAAPVDWPAVHATLVEGATLTFDDVRLALDALDDGPALAAAVALGDSSPWLRRDGVTWTVTPRESALARLAAVAARQRAEQEDKALGAWWPRRGTAPPPPEAAGAVEALCAFAMRGESPATDRGRVLAARIDLPEPDQTLEALVGLGLVPEDANPAPWRAGVGEDFSRGVLHEAQAVAAAAPAADVPREDFTALHAVAIDDAETTEVDDAVSVRRVPADDASGGGGDDVEVLVHISDGAACVPLGGKLDAAARARASSLYLPEGAVTMLPPELVRGRASLDAGRVREAVTGIFRVRPDGSLASARFVRSLVRVTRRLTYGESQDVGTLAGSREDAVLLEGAARALRAARVAAGAVVTGLSSLSVHVEGGAPSVEVRHQDTPGDLVVTEAAVLFNGEAGRLLAAKDVAALFRTQDPPRGDAPDPSDPLWPVLVRRRFSPTHLRTEPARHHGVGCDAYAQATSPLRRYADLVNQRQLVAVLAGAVPPYRPADVETLAAHLSDRERAVRRASTAREEHWIARWVQARGLTEVEGVLARAPRRGLGAVWVDDLLSEFPLRSPEGWRPPPEGTRARWRIERILPWRGRIELGPQPNAAG